MPKKSPVAIARENADRAAAGRHDDIGLPVAVDIPDCNSASYQAPIVVRHDHECPGTVAQQKVQIGSVIDDRQIGFRVTVEIAHCQSASHRVQEVIRHYHEGAVAISQKHVQLILSYRRPVIDRQITPAVAVEVSAGSMERVAAPKTQNVRISERAESSSPVACPHGEQVSSLRVEVRL